MNEELIRQIAREGAASEYESLGLIGMSSNFLAGSMDDTTDVKSAEHAIRLYHARVVAPLVEVLDEAYGELVADSTRDTVRCLLLTNIEKALAPFQKEEG